MINDTFTKLIKMKHTLLIILLLISGSGLTQIGTRTEYASYIINGIETVVNIDTKAIVSMNMGESVMLGAKEVSVNGSGITIMSPSTGVGEWELTGGYTAPIVTVSVNVETTYNITSGKLIITGVKDKFYEGTFEGISKTYDGEHTVSGKFCIELDM